jgi:ribosomal protein S17E
MNEKENRNVVSKDLAPSSARLRNEVRGIADKFTDAFKEIKRRGD